MSAILFGYSKCLHLLHLKGFYCQLISYLFGYSSYYFLVALKGFCGSAILLATLQSNNYRNKLGLIALLLLGLMYGKLNRYVIRSLKVTLHCDCLIKSWFHIAIAILSITACGCRLKIYIHIK